MSTVRIRRGVLLATLLSPIVAACGSTLTSRATPTPAFAELRNDGQASRAVSRDLTLTTLELALVDGTSTLDAVRRLRPEFLQGSDRQPVSGKPEIALYVNDMYEGDVSLLNTIPLSQIRTISFMHPTEARSHYGATCRCGSGVILVVTRRTR
jgi:hypothetical protein